MTKNLTKYESILFNDLNNLESFNKLDNRYDKDNLISRLQCLYEDYNKKLDRIGIFSNKENN